MEGFPRFIPETNDSDEDIESKPEKKDKKKKKSPERLKDKPEKNQPPLEKLAEDEKKIVVEEYVNSRQDELKEELHQTPADSTAEAEVLANAALIETIQDKLSEQTNIEEGGLDNALDETIAELDLSTQEDDTEIEDEEADEEDDDDHSSATPTSVSTPVSPPPPPPPPGPPSLAGPTPPTPPVPPTTVMPAGSAGSGITPMPTPPEVVVEKRSAAPLLLVGGIVGYLIGRRRGRIKTEARLMPIQEKLTKQVEDLQVLVSQKELKIRKLVRQQLEKQPTHEKQVFIEKIEAKLNKPKQAEMLNQKEPSQPERLGRLALVPERTQENKPKSVDLMTLPEVLEVAQKIKMENRPLAALYHAERLNEAGLRHIVKAYLRGERYEKLVHENLRTPEHLSVEHENLQNYAQSFVSANSMTENEINFTSTHSPIEAQPTKTHKIVARYMAVPVVVSVVVIIAILFVLLLLRGL